MSYKHERSQIVSRPGSRNVKVFVGNEVVIDAHGVRDGKRSPEEMVKQSRLSTFVVKTDSGSL